MAALSTEQTFADIEDDQDVDLDEALHGTPQIVSDSQIILLNVGGTKFQTTASTLRKSGYFRSLLSGKYGDKQRDGSYFIDRSAKYFEYLLDYMRCGYVAIPTKYATILHLEAQFYQMNLDLTHIIKKLKWKHVMITAAMNNEDCIQLDGCDINKLDQETIHKYDLDKPQFKKMSAHRYDLEALCFHFIEHCGYRLLHHLQHVYHQNNGFHAYILGPDVPDTVVIQTRT
eukprot:128512_1